MLLIRDPADRTKDVQTETLVLTDSTRVLERAEGLAELGGIFTLNPIIDGGGATILTGEKFDIMFDFRCRLLEWRLLADQAGTFVMTMWRDSYANYPPTIADLISGTTPPTLTAAIKARGDVDPVNGWLPDFVADDVMRLVVSSTDDLVTRVTLALLFQRT